MFNGYRVPTGDCEEVLEIDVGDGEDGWLCCHVNSFNATEMYTKKIIKMVNFMYIINNIFSRAEKKEKKEGRKGRKQEKNQKERRKW